MCGYCTEIFALAAVRWNQTSAPTWAKSTQFYIREPMLQEAQDYGALFDGSEKPPSRSESIVWLGRAMQILMHEGYDASTYQSLLAAPRFLVSVERYCGDPQAETYKQAASPLDVVALRWLGERETWLGPGVFARHADQVTTDYCEALLMQYSASCLRAADQDEGGTIAASMTGMALTELEEFELRDQFDNWLLPLMLAVAKLAEPSCPDQTMLRTLMPIIKGDLKWSPCFEASELWLERQIALALYDRFGVEPFAANLYWLRYELLQYLALTGRIDARERERLLEAFRQCNMRGDGNFFSLHHWLIEGDLLQSLAPTTFGE